VSPHTGRAQAARENTLAGCSSFIACRCGSRCGSTKNAPHAHIPPLSATSSLPCVSAKRMRGALLDGRQAHALRTRTRCLLCGCCVVSKWASVVQQSIVSPGLGIVPLVLPGEVRPHLMPRSSPIWPKPIPSPNTRSGLNHGVADAKSTAAISRHAAHLPYAAHVSHSRRTPAIRPSGGAASARLTRCSAICRDTSWKTPCRTG
jgi:hypothetical protein